MRWNKSIALISCIVFSLFLFSNARAQQTKTVYVKDKATRTGKVNPHRGSVKVLDKDKAVQKKVRTDRPKKSNKYLSNNKKKKKLKPKIRLVRPEFGCPCYKNFNSKVAKKRNKKLRGNKVR